MTEETAHVTRALSAVTGRRGAEAVSSLLALWRETRDPDVADAIEAVTSQRWLGDSVLADQLAALASGSAGQIGKRVLELETLSPDPRIARALVELIDHPPVTSAVAGPLFTKVFAVLAKNEDPRAVVRLRALDEDARRGDIGKRIEANAPKIAAAMEVALRDRQRALGKPAREKLKSLRTELAALEAPKPVRSTADLLAEIYANPDSDEPRLVLADVLQEQGDPRGELIVLQIEATKRELTPAEKKAERGLLRTHGKQWIGRLAKAVQAKELAFERGFPAVGRAYPPSESVLDAVLDAPEWATFRDLAVGYERMPIESLRHAHVLRLGQALLNSVLEHPSPLRVEELSAFYTYNFGYLASSLAEAKSLPRLRALDVGHPRPWSPETSQLSELSALLELPIMRQLESFTSTTIGGAEVARSLAAVKTKLPGLLRFGFKEAGWEQGFALGFSRTQPGGTFDTLTVHLREESRNREIQDRSPSQWLSEICEELPETSIRTIRFTSAKEYHHAAGASAVHNAAAHFTDVTVDA